MSAVTKAAAAMILGQFDEYRRAFIDLTNQAGQRFAQANWNGVSAASTDRIVLYRQFGEQTAAKLVGETGADCFSDDEWVLARSHYQDLIAGRLDHELAETGFNTVFRKIRGPAALSAELAFVEPAAVSGGVATKPFSEAFGPTTNLEGLMRDVLVSYELGVDFYDIDADLGHIVTAMSTMIPLLRKPAQMSVEMVKAVFYRNKGAYLIGKLMIEEHLFPFALPLQHHQSGPGIICDAVIWNENDLSTIFSFTRAYFMVHAEQPATLVNFLHDLLPAKKRWELYTALGYYKHGKTEFFRGFVHHLAASDDEFVIAEGIKGMVMAVFTLPSYQTVFKIIKDKFSPTKTVTHEGVRAAYALVKSHDRVGRMADTQEFVHFVLPKHRFSSDLLAYLERVAASSLRIEGDNVVISHLYTERLMTPMNIYINQCSDFERRQVLKDYGLAIKQLAAANIFPGDMLMKNFGVTRHGRVVFYDYDEICYLTEVNFREIPKAQSSHDAMTAEPWFSVGPHDVFPEEFATFLFSSPSLREEFCEYHADLFDPAYWQTIQSNVLEQQMLDVYPYKEDRQFVRADSAS